MFYSCRLAFHDLDTTWNRKGNPEPWNEFADKQFKVKILTLNWLLISDIFLQFYSPTMDYSKIKSPAPKY